ncbi:hypothetical protein RAS1_16650 [Phycisphaerae bacterium RAS1]|nr:hypothetical protein RAS1_16650 [Phycisphaerae bacterium RAS1]
MAHGHAQHEELDPAELEREQHDDPKPSATAFALAVGIIVVIVSVIGLQALYFAVESDHAGSAAVQASFPTRTQLKNEQLAGTGGYRWVDKQAGIVAVPVDRAMELVLPDLKAGKNPNTIALPAAPPATATAPSGSGRN